METTQMSLRLFVDEKTKRVVFAECGSDFVDVLLSFLTMPIGTIIRLTGKESKIGKESKTGKESKIGKESKTGKESKIGKESKTGKESKIVGMSKLYESVKDDDVSLLRTKACKNMLLYPKNASEEHCKNLKVNIDDTEKLYEAECVASSKEEVFVERNKKFIVRDDLRVFPSDSKKAEQGFSTSVYKKEVNVGEAEVLHLLKWSLLSETPLTDMIDALHLNDQDKNGNGGTSNKVSVKLTVNKSNKKVVYAEGGEEFTDLLFSFLAFPLGFVAKFFAGDSGVKCLDNLYRSVQVLKKFIESNECEGLLVDPNDPKLGPYFSCKNQPLQIKEQNPWQPTIIGCICSKVISGNNVKIIDYSSRVCGHVRPKKQLIHHKSKASESSEGVRRILYCWTGNVLGN